MSVLVGVISATVWRHRGNGDRWQVLLCGLVVLNGAGSFVFHTNPTPLTLQLDLVPEAIFSGVYLIYVATVRLRMRVWLAVAGLVALLLVEEGLVAVAAGAFGAGVRHVPSLVLLFGVGAYLLRAGDPLGRYALWAGAAYLAALTFRTYDLAICARFPLGLHWMWHVCGAITEGLLLLG